MKKIVLLVLTLVVALSLTPLIVGSVNDNIGEIEYLEFDLTITDIDGVGPITITFTTTNFNASFFDLFDEDVELLLSIDGVPSTDNDFYISNNPIEAIRSDTQGWIYVINFETSTAFLNPANGDTPPTLTEGDVLTFTSTFVINDPTNEPVNVFLGLLPLFYVVVVILGGVLFAYFSFKKE